MLSFNNFFYTVGVICKCVVTSVSKKKACVLLGCVLHHVFRVPPQDTLNRKSFGQDLPSVENEVEEHNIFQSEVEALVPHLPKTGDKVRPQDVSTE